MTETRHDPVDAIVIGSGLAGLVAARELATRGRRTLILEQEPDCGLGGQAFWSLGGLFMVDTPEQRRLGIRDSRDLAAQDWFGTARFDRPEDHWPRRWAEAYLDFASGPMRRWLHGLGMRWFPVVGWAERGGGQAGGPGNSVPRFHLTWGTGPGVVEPFEARIRDAMAAGTVQIRCRHRVTDLVTEAGRVTGVAGEVLADSGVRRGEASSRDAVGRFTARAESVVVCSGGIGGDHDRVRQLWPTARLGPAPRSMVSGVPAHVDGAMLDVASAAGAHAINTDRMWHYTEGIRNWDPIWPRHGIRILPGPSPLWFDALSQRMEAPALPGFDTLATLKRILATGHDHSWFVLTQKIIEKEFALSGSEQNPDFTAKSWRGVLRDRLSRGAPAPVEAFKANGADFVVARDFDTLADGMERLAPETPPDRHRIKAQILDRDRQLTNRFAKDAQITALRGARAYLGDRLVRVAAPHRILDRTAGPLIAVKLHILTRKSLGGLTTDLDGRVLGRDGAPVPGLYAAGEVAGFGGGGYHGYAALEGTFLGGCVFSGRAAGQAA